MRTINLESHVEKHAERDGDSPLKGPYEARQVPADDRVKWLSPESSTAYYDAVIAAVRDVDAMCYSGPGEAKGVQEASGQAQARGANRVETADKMTDGRSPPRCANISGTPPSKQAQERRPPQTPGMYHRIEAAASPSTYLGADRASIGDRLARLTSSVEGMLSFLAQHDSQKAIHDIRVAARRLRVALRNLKRKLPRRERRRCMKALLEITNSCRAARDADVRQHLVEIWLSRAGLEDHEQGQLLLAMAVQDTEAARHELRRRMNAPKWSHVLWNFRQSAAALVVDDSSDDGFLRDVLSHQRRRLRRGLRKREEHAKAPAAASTPSENQGRPIFCRGFRSACRCGGRRRIDEASRAAECPWRFPR